MDKSNKIELLSPAGSLDSLKQAVHNGADAVYLGGTQFGARAYANNFDDEELKQAINYAHLYGVKVHITANTLIYENEVKTFKKYIEYLASLGVDAIIIQDIGMANWAINSFDVPIHSSTQMHNYSISNVEYLKTSGFNRAVAARETHIDDIKKMSEIMDTEIFAHGALCISYSGQCLFSAIEHNRSGNRGKCAQACRMKYSLYADDKLLIENKHLLSPKDLALLDDVTEIIDAGASSIKLEGRMKSPEYVGFVTKTYRKIIDNYYLGKNTKTSNADKDILKHLFNRGFTKGYTFGLDNQSLMSVDRPNHAGVHIGDVVSTTKDFISVKLTSPLHQGDGVKLDKSDKGFVCNKIYYKGKLVSKGNAGQTIQLDNKQNIRGTDKLLLTKDVSLLKSLSQYSDKKIPVNITGEFYVNTPSKITISESFGNTISSTGAIVEQSKNAPLSVESIKNSLAKLGDSPYIAKDIKIKKDDNIFLSKSSINKLRRYAVEKLNAKRTAVIKYDKRDYKINYSAPLPSPISFSCTVSNESQLKSALEFNTKIYVRDYNLYCKYKSSGYIYYFMDGLSGNTENHSGERLVVRDTGGIRYAQNNEVTADYMLNITNSQSLAHLHAQGVNNACLSIELGDDNVKMLTSNYAETYGSLPNAEMLVYGRIQLMAMKHCILEGNIKCGQCRKSGIYLTDIKGSKFPVTVDKNCNNYIYSKDIIDKTDSIEYLKSLGISGFRLDFMDESPDEIERIMNKITG